MVVDYPVFHSIKTLLCRLDNQHGFIVMLDFVIPPVPGLDFGHDVDTGSQAFVDYPFGEIVGFLTWYRYEDNPIVFDKI